MPFFECGYHTVLEKRVKWHAFCISFTKENSLEKFGNTRLGGCHCDLSKEEFLSECRRTVGNEGNRRKRSTICTS